MPTIEAQRNGGKVTAIRFRQQALDCYYNDPKHCKQCKLIIVVREGEKISGIRRRDFCNHTCAAIFTNSLKPRKRLLCSLCNRETRPRNAVTGNLLFCRSCLPQNRRPLKDQAITKGELFKRRSCWQSARTHIRVHAYRVFIRSGQPHGCRMCQYEHHFEICHIIAVSDFPDTATVQEINAPDNLCGLCPNCHWEFDNGLITKEELGARARVELAPETL